jgi:hypothetical protein
LENDTLKEYFRVIESCEKLFKSKTLDYGTAWRILRLPSITDQIYIKAQRIRSIQEKGKQMVGDDISSEFVGIVNYCIIALMQMNLPEETELELGYEKIEPLYQQAVKETIGLLKDKNHDYGEAWRSMRIASITDIILMKVRRVKQIEDNQGKTIVSEGIKANYQDIMNYAVFSLIKLNYGEDEDSR